jgi:hypothetical protein
LASGTWASVVKKRAPEQESAEERFEVGMLDYKWASGIADDARALPDSVGARETAESWDEVADKAAKQVTDALDELEFGKGSG